MVLFPSFLLFSWRGMRCERTVDHHRLPLFIAHPWLWFYDDVVPYSLGSRTQQNSFLSFLAIVVSGQVEIEKFALVGSLSWPLWPAKFSFTFLQVWLKESQHWLTWWFRLIITFRLENKKEFGWNVFCFYLFLFHDVWSLVDFRVPFTFFSVSLGAICEAGPNEFLFQGWFRSSSVFGVFLGVGRDG